MRISERVHTEGARELITLVPETLDDLWHLSYILEPGDHVAGHTSRRIQRDDDTLRDTGGQREHMYLTLEVDEVSFHKFANRLRIGGKIIECAREDQLGYHHTLNVEVHDEVSVEKIFKPDQLERLEEAVESAEQPTVAIVTVEEGEAFVHTIAQYGTEEYASIRGPTGKGDYARPRSELFDNIANTISHLDVDAIILAGPGFTKQDVHRYLQENYSDLAEGIRLVDTSAVGERGVHEVLKRGAVDEIQTETRIAREAELIDTLMRQLSTDEKVAYGLDEVQRAVEYGAVETLLIIDERLRDERAGNGSWSIDVNDLIQQVEQQGGSVTVFSSEFEPANQLHHLGDIAALLRFRLD